MAVGGTQHEIGGMMFSGNDKGPAPDDANNSWNTAGVTVTEADFQSVATTGVDAPRQADGCLPVLPNFRLAPRLGQLARAISRLVVAARAGRFVGAPPSTLVWAMERLRRGGFRCSEMTTFGVGPTAACSCESALEAAPKC